MKLRPAWAQGWRMPKEKSEKKTSDKLRGEQMREIKQGEVLAGVLTFDIEQKLGILRSQIQRGEEVYPGIGEESSVFLEVIQGLLGEFIGNQRRKLERGIEVQRQIGVIVKGHEKRVKFHEDVAARHRDKVERQKLDAALVQGLLSEKDKSDLDGIAEYYKGFNERYEGGEYADRQEE